MTTEASIEAHPPLVLVVDFGAQYAQLIARRVREARVYSEIVPHSMPVGEMLAKEPAAVILSGGPSSIYEEGAPRVERALLESGVPVLGVCYGFHAMADALGGTVERTDTAEFGRTEVTVRPCAKLFAGQPADVSGFVGVLVTVVAYLGFRRWERLVGRPQGPAPAAVGASR